MGLNRLYREPVNELSLIISLGLNEEQICTAVYVHPSLSEIIVEAIRNGV